MSLQVALQLSPEATLKLEASIARRDGESARQVLAEAVEIAVAEMLEQGDVRINAPASRSNDSPNEEEIDALLEELARIGNLAKAPPLSDYALSRESMYEDRP